MRHFKPIFIDQHTASQIIPVKDPILYICLSNIDEDKEKFKVYLGNLKNSLALGVIVDSSSRLQEPLFEVLALQRTQRNSPELVSDPVALRELKDRLSTAIKNEQIAISSILEETNQSAWYWGPTRYKIPNKRMLQELLTKILKKNYTSTPYLQNELINRDRPSASAMAGRKRLLFAMLKMEIHEDLGIEKFPPEKAIYRSILRASGLHVKTKKGWRFQAPKTNNSKEGSIHKLWQSIEDILENSELKPFNVTDLYEKLSESPCGVKAGLLPVLLLAVCLAYKDEIAIYEAGYYSPFLTQLVVISIVTIYLIFKPVPKCRLAQIYLKLKGFGYQLIYLKLTCSGNATV